MKTAKQLRTGLVGEGEEIMSTDHDDIRARETIESTGGYFAPLPDPLAELARLKAERDKLRSVLEQCLRRLDKLNEGGPDEPDPTVTMVRAVLKRTEPASNAATTKTAVGDWGFKLGEEYPT